jgi:hypothetical protein
MSIEEAQKIERPPVQVGQQYPFYSTMVQEYLPQSEQIRRHTSHYVDVIEIEFDDSYSDWIEGESERCFKVRAADGTKFHALEGELNGWFRDTGQFYNADGTWGPKKCRDTVSPVPTDESRLAAKTRRGLAEYRKRQGG